MGKPLDAQTWFERADRYYWSCCALMERRHHLYEIIGFPHVVLRAFAAEAYLKCLITLQGKDPIQVHNLLTLFDELELGTKKALAKRWVKECEPSLKKLKKSKKTVINFDTSLRGVLNQSGDAFIDFRYVLKGGVARFSIMRFPMFVRDEILTIKPEFMPRPPDLLAQLNEDSCIAKPEDYDFRRFTLGLPVRNRESTPSNSASSGGSANPNDSGA